MNTLSIRDAAFAVALFALGLLAATTVAAQPTTLSYQGYLEQSGAPLNNTNATLTFRLFRNATGGSALWTETKSGVSIADGVFNVALGSGTALPATLFDGSLHLSVAVGGTGATQLSPRTVFRAAPYARTLSAPARVVGTPSGDTDALRVENRATAGHGSGLLATSASPDGQGLVGWATATTGHAEGVIGRTEAPIGSGVAGLAMAPEGSTFGVYGYTASTDGIGVLGEAAATGLFSTHGVVGRGFYGVTGYADPNGTAVVGYDYNGTGRAGYFRGDVDVIGVLSKGGGAFQIDHPLDPERRILRHSFVESPDMMNVYNGVATLDRRGEAVVVLPEWFEVLNRDFRYGLTAIGTPMPDLYVAEEVQDNRFRIAGGAPGGRVSWQVTGIRHDAWANENRIVVEEDKPSEDRGRYLHPTAFGRPRERGVDYERTRPPSLRARAESERVRAEPPPSHDQ